MNVRSVGIVGYGNFGEFLYGVTKRYAPGVSVRVYEPSKAVDGTLFFSKEETAGSDVVIFAVPISAFESSLREFLPLMPVETLIVDVATVKAHTAGLLKQVAAGRSYVAMHPMFGPESYAKKGRTLQGLRVVVCEHTLSDNDYEHFRKMLAELGLDIVRMDAEAHDQHLAHSLFLTHFIGQIVARAGFDRTPVDTVSFGYLMDAVESVKNDTGLFKDVYQYVPYCKEVMERFRIAEKEVSELLQNDVR